MLGWIGVVSVVLRVSVTSRRPAVMVPVGVNMIMIMIVPVAMIMAMGLARSG